MSRHRIYSVVAMAAEIEEARRVYYAANDAHNWTESKRLGEIWSNLFQAERDLAPTSDADAAQKFRNAAASARLDPCPASERLARAAIRAAVKVERGEITPELLHSLRALMPAAMSHDVETYNDGTTAKALAHAINWCARLKLV
jgi:hypothetical protein